jgi:hypothetical protein
MLAVVVCAACSCYLAAMGTSAFLRNGNVSIPSYRAAEKVGGLTVAMGTSAFLATGLQRRWVDSLLNSKLWLLRCFASTLAGPAAAACNAHISMPACRTPFRPQRSCGCNSLAWFTASCSSLNNSHCIPIAAETRATVQLMLLTVRLTLVTHGCCCCCRCLSKASLC